MKEKGKTLWWRVRATLPAMSRRGKVIRNLVTVFVLVFFCWFLLDSPAFSLEQEYRRAARRNLLVDTEVLTIVDTGEWPDWTDGEMIAVAENETYYVVCLNSYELECWEKQGEVMMAAMPADASIFPTDYHPFLLLTQLPAHRAEVVFTLPPEMDFGRTKQFEGATFRAEAEGENGVFLFCLPDGLQENQMTYSQQRQLQGHALHILADAMRGLAQDYGCSATVDVRLWDAQDQLIYDETLIYDIKG